ncbi:glycosyltransferase [Sinomonas flava]
MSRFFEVRVVDASGDYDEICDQFEPDLCMFESGVYAGERELRNTSAHPQVPKLGFLHADAFDASRAAFVTDMARWGVSSYVTTSMSMGDYTPEIGERLFVWPNMVDPGMYANVRRQHLVPVLLTGSRARHYPWRNAVSRVLEENFTTISMPHFGWAGERGTERMAWGQDYARLLAAAAFIPTCGTVTKDLVRKHLEIPAAGACLVTQRTPAVVAAGFRDMVNCVFAEADDVVDRLETLLADPDRLAAITEAGRDWVLEHHTAEHRDQVLQWYRIVSHYGPGTAVTQSWPDGRLAPVPSEVGPSQRLLASDGLDRHDIAAGWEALSRRNPAAAERAFGRALNYFFIPEAAVGMTHASLQRGDVRAAQEWVSRLLVTSLSHYGAPEPDPVFWAYQIRVHVCSGDMPSAMEAAARYPALRHPELDRIRAAVLARRLGTAGRTEEPRASAIRPSIAPPPPVDESAWMLELKVMVSACSPKRVDLTRGVRALVPALPSPVAASWGRGRVAALASRHAAGRVRSAPVAALRGRLAPIKRRLMSDPAAREVAAVLEDEPVSSAAIVGAARSRVSRAVREALTANPHVRHIRDDGQLNPAEERQLVFVSRAGWPLIGGIGPLLNARVVVLEGTTRPDAARALEDLIDRGRFAVVVHVPRYKDGCAVLRHLDVPRGASEVGGPWSD